MIVVTSRIVVLDLIDHGYAAAVIPLAEYALRTVEQAVGYVDDSDGGCLRAISERATRRDSRSGGPQLGRVREGGRGRMLPQTPVRL